MSSFGRKSCNSCKETSQALSSKQTFYEKNQFLQGNNLAEAKEMAMKMAKDEKSIYINGYDHPDIIAGQGTVGLEICEQIQNVDAVVVPVGGGGLLAGMAVAVKKLSPMTKVIVNLSFN